MEFTVPQFIEEETKIIGPLSFRQVIFIGISIGICVVLWFTVSNLIIFIFLSIIIVSIGVSLALLKINKTQLPIYIKNYFIFNFGPKIYFWKKENKRIESKISQKTIEKKEFNKKNSLPLTKKSKMQDLFVEISSKKSS